MRFIGNYSSGKQGYAVAAALRAAGAQVTLVSGPSALSAPADVQRINVTSAAEMLSACEQALPCDIAVCTAAVSDWRPKAKANQKIKKQAGSPPPVLEMEENPDILKHISNHSKRPRIVIGFAAETNDLIDNAKAKIESKGCDWICANDVLANDSFGNDTNSIHFLSGDIHEIWEQQSKITIAGNIVEKIAEELG